ncbi:hypothetical protein BvCmsC51A_04596 [Escherichia coli]|nr:hypothetical protein BvCmsC51A_04596 [Escherichia coli]GDE83065.1 hypothetical protein BvCmsKKNP009_00571 [Escherichia coli]
MFLVSNYYRMCCIILFMDAPILFSLTKPCKFDVIHLCDN